MAKNVCCKLEFIERHQDWGSKHGQVYKCLSILNLFLFFFGGGGGGISVNHPYERKISSKILFKLDFFFRGALYDCVRYLMIENQYDIFKTYY